MQETGIISRFKQKWMHNNGKNIYGMAEAARLDIENMIFPFVILVWGIVSAAAISLAEWLLIHFRIVPQLGQCCFRYQTVVIRLFYCRVLKKIDLQYQMSFGNHGTLVKELAMHPLLFSKAKIWLVPTHCAHVPLRLDSRVYFYDGSESDNIAVYERLIKNGRLARRTLFNWPQEKKHYLRAFEKQSIIRSSVIWPCPFLMQLQM